MLEDAFTACREFCKISKPSTPPEITQGRQNCLCHLRIGFYHLCKGCSAYFGAYVAFIWEKPEGDVGL